MKEVSKRLEEVLYNCGYDVLEYEDWLKSGMPSFENIVVKNKPYKKSGHSSLSKAELFIPSKNLAIKNKYQSVSGSAREKLFFDIADFSTQPFNTIIVYQGRYYSEEFVNFAHEFIESNFQFKTKIKLLDINSFSELFKKEG